MRLRRRVLAIVSAGLSVASLAVVPVAALAADTTSPVVLSLSVTTGPVTGGTRITVHGEHLLRAASIKFDNKVGSDLRIVSSTTAVVTSPSYRARRVSVYAVDASGQVHYPAEAPRFTYINPPLVMKTFHLNDPRRVTVEGFNLGRATRVTFDGHAGSKLLVLDPERIHVTAPAGTAGNAVIRVTSPYGTSTPVTARRYSYLAVPVVTAVSPDADRPVNGGAVQIIGRNFSGLTGVSVGGIALRRDSGFVPGDAQHLSFFPPSHAPGLTHVVVTTQFSRSRVSIASRYRFLEPSPVWTDVSEHDPLRGHARGISCPTPTFCALVDDTHASTWDGSSWAPAQSLVGRSDVGDALETVSCASPDLCLVASRAGVIFDWDGTSWQVSQDTDTDVAACSLSGWCLAAGGYGLASVTTDGSGWMHVPGPGVALTALSCPQEDFCVGTRADHGAEIYRSGTWHAADAPAQLTAISCPAVDDCTALSADGNAYHLDASGWSSPAAVFPATAGAPAALSCPVSGWCLATDTSGQIAHLSGEAWSAPSQLGLPDDALGAASCSAEAQCLVADSVGQVFVQDDSWSAPQPAIRAQGALTSISCASSSFCVAADAVGSVVRWDGQSWSGLTPVDPAPQLAPSVVSCASEYFCALIDDGDQPRQARVSLYRSGTWTAPVVLTEGHALSALSCVDDSFCVALGDDGSSWVFDGDGWDRGADTGLSGDAVSVSCTAADDCIAVDGLNAAYFDGDYWQTATNVAPQPLLAVSCTSATFCLATGTTPEVFDGSVWRPAPGSPAGTTVDCVSPTSCVVSGVGTRSWDGTEVTDASTAFDTANSVSCWADQSCMATSPDASNEIFRSSPPS